jgi:DNA-binding transcriptional ArsR family regulator
MDVFGALAEGNRRKLLDALMERSLSVNELNEVVPRLGQPAVSRHLHALRQAGLVQSATDGPRRIYSLRPGGLDEVERWLARHRRFWASRLDALEKHLARKAAKAGDAPSTNNTPTTTTKKRTRR